MAIFGTSIVLILIPTVFMSIAPSATGNKLTDIEIKHLCSKTNNLGSCYKLLKSDPRTTNVDARGLAEVSVDLASKKSCSSNYTDAIRDLKAIKNYLKSGAFKNIPVQVKDASEEIKQCKKVFGGATSDGAHIKKKNQEFEFLISIVEVTSNNLNKN
ncbi:pectinesterase inhibitor-like [Sesamum indicum]|uniref:Pectinesterase inhibitor-like n=1 Tax=Sesamum indicum TaxID=4182 RepID=A0A6I9V214_SESIN|nr:pectinesterase inhibitor-like [Sesamum indicum]